MLIKPENKVTMTPEERAVLQGVQRHQPLNASQHQPVLNLIAGGFLHVTPVFDRSDRCPYRLTEAGLDALREKS